MKTEGSEQVSPPDLPVLTEIVSGDDLPTLTDIVDAPEMETPAFALAPDSSAGAPSLPEEDAFEPPPQLESHLEELFMQRLLPRLEAAQRQAVAQTWAELKDELPQLIRNARPPRA